MAVTSVPPPVVAEFYGLGPILGSPGYATGIFAYWRSSDDVISSLFCKCEICSSLCRQTETLLSSPYGNTIGASEIFFGANLLGLGNEITETVCLS